MERGGYLRCLTQGFYLYFSNSQFYKKRSLLNLRRHKVSYTNFVCKNHTWQVDGLDICNLMNNVCLIPLTDRLTVLSLYLTNEKALEGDTLHGGSLYIGDLIEIVFKTI